MRRNLINTYISSVNYAIAQENGISKATLRNRVWNLNWPIKRAVTEPVREKENDNSKWIEVAKENGININTFYGRIKLGWSAERAATTPTGKKGRPRKEK